MPIYQVPVPGTTVDPVPVGGVDIFPVPAIPAPSTTPPTVNLTTVTTATVPVAVTPTVTTQVPVAGVVTSPVTYGPATVDVLLYQDDRPLVPFVGNMRMYLDEDYASVQVDASLVAPADRDFQVGLLQNGAQVLVVTIPAGFQWGTATLTTSLPRGTYLGISVLQTGLVLTGANLTVTLRLVRTF